MRILIVEDEKTICQNIAKSLIKEGYEVDTSNDGEDACYLIEVEK